MPLIGAKIDSSHARCTSKPLTVDAKPSLSVYNLNIEKSMLMRSSGVTRKNLSASKLARNLSPIITREKSRNAPIDFTTISSSV